MEPVEDIKDYRSLSEEQLKAELKTLEACILEITHDQLLSFSCKHMIVPLDWCGETRTTLCKISGQGLRAFGAGSVFSRQTLPTHYGLYCAVGQIRRAGSVR